MTDADTEKGRTRYRVVNAHDASSASPLKVRTGERLAFERRETRWAGWIYCTDAGGNGSWVPESWVDIEGSTCTMRRDYDAVELTVRAGETLSGSTVESGWVWAVNAQGASGWVPLECLEAIAGTRS